MSAIARMHQNLPASNVPSLPERRFQFINLWRPISHPADELQLALSDYRSIDLVKDTVPIALVYPDHEGETMGILYNPDHKWKYLCGITQDEFILIKCFDSIEDGKVARFTHTSFQDSISPEDAVLRESIELRALGFYD